MCACVRVCECVRVFVCMRVCGRQYVKRRKACVLFTYSYKIRTGELSCWIETGYVLSLTRIPPNAGVPALLFYSPLWACLWSVHILLSSDNR